MLSKAVPLNKIFCAMCKITFQEFIKFLQEWCGASDRKNFVGETRSGTQVAIFQRQQNKENVDRKNWRKG